jgi:phage/plasmid-associated DNA primase
MVSSYIYLIQDTKYKNTNTYKVGKTTQNGDCRRITRLQCYNKYSTIEYIRAVDINHVDSIEIEIINSFNKIFDIIEGNEWFNGNKEQMIQIINTIIENNNLNIVNIPLEPHNNIINYIDYKNINSIDQLKSCIIQVYKQLDILDYVNIIKYLYGNHYIINNIYKLYCYNGKYWEQNDVLLRNCISTELYDFLRTILVEVYWNTKDFTQLKSKIDKLKSLNYKREVIETYKEYGLDNTIMFDDKWWLLGFNNLVYDMELCEFRTYKYDDYISTTTGYDWREPTSEEMDTMYKLLDLIMPIKEEREAYLQILSTGLDGRCLEKFIIFNGNGGNGKGVIDDIMLLALGDYAMIGNNGILFETSKTGSNPEKANLHKKRFVVFREPSEKNKFENSTVKELTGGGSFSARGLYENSANKELNLTMIIECNKRPLFKEEPGDAEVRRIIDILFRSSFVSDETQVNPSNNIFKANPLYKTREFQEKHKYALLKILMQEHYKYYKLNKSTFKLPQSIIDRSRQYLEMSCNIVEWFKDNYEETSELTEYTPIKDIYELFKTSEFYCNLSKADRAKYTKKYINDYISTNIFFRRYYAERYNNIRSVIKGWICKQQV